MPRQRTSNLLASDEIVFSGVIVVYTFMQLYGGWENFETVPPSATIELINTYILLTWSFTLISSIQASTSSCSALRRSVPDGFDDLVVRCVLDRPGVFLKFVDALRTPLEFVVDVSSFDRLALLAEVLLLGGQFVDLVL